MAVVAWVVTVVVVVTTVVGSGLAHPYAAAPANTIRRMTKMATTWLIALRANQGVLLASANISIC